MSSITNRLGMPNAQMTETSESNEIHRLRKEMLELKEQNQQQARELEVYKNIINNFPNGALVLLDEEFRYQIAGGDLFSKLGVAPSSIISKTPMDIATHSINDVIVPSFNQLQEETVITTENPVGTDKIMLQSVKLTNTILPNQQKSILIVATDITKQKRDENILEKNEAKFRALFENSPNGIMLTDENGFITEVNQTQLKIIGAKAEDREKYLNKLNVKNFYIYQNAGIQQHYIDLFEKRKAFTLEVESRSLFGKNCVLRIVAIPILDKNNELKGSIINVEDIDSRKKVEQALKASEEQYRKTINSIDDFIFVVDLNFEIVLINETLNKWSSIFDLPNVIVGKNFIQLFEHIEPSIRRNYQWVFNNGESLKFEHTIRNKGIEYWTEIKALPVKDTYGRVIQVVTVIKDITERKKAEFELKLNEQRLNALLEFAQQKFVDLKEITSYTLEQCLKLTGSKIGSISLVNSATKEIELYSWKEEVLESRVRQNIHTAIFRDFFYEGCRAGSPILVNNLAEFPGRKALPAEVKSWNRFASIPIYEDGQVVAVVGLANKPYAYDDIDIKQIELLMESVWKLKSQIETNEQIKISEQRLRELNATKDKFFSIIAHDLASPFNSLMGFSDLLCANAYSYDRDKISKIAGTLKKSAETGYTLLENLLDWSRTQTGRLKPNPVDFDLAEMIHEMVVNLESKANEKDITVVFSEKRKLMVNADPNMINTVLRNIINNSIKFSYIGGKIKINAENQDNGVIIHIADSGIGIDDADKGHIFGLESFSKIGTANEKGTGLGLLLCREFVEKNKGQIWFESKKGLGSKFSFSLQKGNE